MLLDIEKSGEPDQECSREWSLNTDPVIKKYKEENQLVIFDMKNISRGCVVRR